MAPSFGPVGNAFDVRFRVHDGDVSHLEREAVGARETRLLERDVRPKRGLDCEALSLADVVGNEFLALFDRLRSNLDRNVSVGAVVQSRCSVIDVEVINAGGRDGEGCGLTAAGGAGDHNHAGSHPELSPRLDVSLGTRLHVRRKALFHPAPIFVDDAEVLELLDGFLDALSGLPELFLLEAGHFLLVLEIDVGPGELLFLDFLRHVRLFPPQ